MALTRYGEINVRFFFYSASSFLGRSVLFPGGFKHFRDPCRDYVPVPQTFTAHVVGSNGAKTWKRLNLRFDALGYYTRELKKKVAFLLELFTVISIS